MEEQTVHLTLQRKVIDYLWSLLAKQPWGEVAPLMADISRQVGQQQEQPATETATDTPPKVKRSRAKKANGSASPLPLM